MPAQTRQTCLALTPHSPASALPDVCLGCYSDLFNGWGGALTAARGLSAACHRRGLDTLLLGVSRAGDGSAPEAPGAPERNVRLRRRPLLWRVQSWDTARRLASHLRRLAPPRRAFVGLSMHWVVAAREAWPSARIVYVFPCLLSHCLPFTWPGPRPSSYWKRLDMAGIRRSEHRAFDLADLTIVPTAAAQAEVRAFHPAARRRITVCTYGCEPPSIDAGLRQRQRAALRLPADAVLFLAVGVCDRNKGFELAVQELATVDRRAHLAIVGDGPGRGLLARRAVELSVADRVRLVGGQRDVTPWYAAADVVLSTSRYDTFPNCVLEGMHYGRPVVVPRHDPPRVYAGIAEVIASGGGGVLYERDRAGALGERMNGLVRDPQARQTLGEQARRVAEQRFRWDPVLDCVLGLGAGEAPAAAAAAGAPQEWTRHGTAAGAGPVGPAAEAVAQEAEPWT